MTKEAVILELDSSNVILLSEEGEFIRLPAHRLPQARYIGQNVSLDQSKPTCKLAWVPLLAACILALLVTIPLLIPSPALAWVSLDSSSSLELLVDNKLNIKEVRPLNNGANNFLAGCEEEYLTFPALIEEFVNWSVQNGDNSLLVTATGDRQMVKACFSKFSKHDLQVIMLEVDPQIRAEAGKMGLSAGRALFMAEASCRGAISPEKFKEGNPIDTLNSAGVNLEAFVSSLDHESQAEKIKDLPPPDREFPEDDPAGNIEDGEPDPPVEDEASEPAADEQEGDQGTNLPPGRAKKDKNHPSICRSGSWGKKNRVPKGQQHKPDKDKNNPSQQDESEQPVPESSETGENVNIDKENPGKGQGKKEPGNKDKDAKPDNPGKDKEKSKGNPDPAKENKGEKKKGPGHDNRDKKDKGKKGKP